MKNIRNLFNRTAFLLTTAAVMTFASCEKDETTEPDDGTGNGNGGNKKSFVDMEDRYFYNFSLGEQAGKKFLNVAALLDEPIMYVTLNPPAGTDNSEIELRITIGIPSTIEMLDNYEETYMYMYPYSDIDANVAMSVSSNKSDKKLFDVVGHPDLFVSDITYRMADGYEYKNVDIDAEARPGDTQYSYYSYKLYLLKKFFDDNAESYSMEVHSNPGGPPTRDCKNVHIPHIITGPDGQVSQDSLDAAKNAIKNNYGYAYLSRIEFTALFEAARIDTTTTFVNTSELFYSGVDASAPAKLKLHK